MDFFRFDPSNGTYLDGAELINGLDSAMWIERYGKLGEFKFESLVSAGLSEFLPMGTIIGHADTLEIMIVESHEIRDNKDEDPMLVISGRSFPSFLENRSVGMNDARSSSTVVPYVIPSAVTPSQIVDLINDHITSADVYDSDDAIDDVLAETDLTTSEETEERTINRGDVSARVLELLSVDEAGIKTVRRNTFNGTPEETKIVIYKGQDKTADVMFSHLNGDFDLVDYLLTQKAFKTSCMVIGQYIYVIVDGAETGYDRRMMYVNATDIDGHFGDVPTGEDLTTVTDAMTVRGQQELAKQNQITINQADISRMSRYQYRTHYNMGDLVSLEGNFNQQAVMRVIEYAEIEDENGESGHPTLAVPVIL